LRQALIMTVNHQLLPRDPGYPRSERVLSFGDEE